jgi:hypothetical protein
MRNCVVAVLIILSCIYFGVPEVRANEKEIKKSPEEDLWYVGPRIGYSPFTGIIGLEIQYRHMALTFGGPGNAGVKYYFSFPKHSWFVGGFYSQYDSDNEETKEGITYTDSNTIEGGIAGGYRWRWGSGWDLSLCLGIAYGEEELTNSYYKRTETYIGFRPGVIFGYSF